MKPFLILTLLFSTLFACSQNDPAAKKILDAVSAKYKTVKTMQANYSLTVTNKAGKNTGTKTGSLFMKGQKYMISDKSLEIRSDGISIWKYEPEANEVTKSPVDNTTQAMTPAKLFTNFYDKDFVCKLNGTKKIGTKALAEIEMTPTAKNKNFTKIYLYVDEKQQLIVSSKVLEATGNVYNYSISNLKQNIVLADDLFVFNKAKHPGVEEISN